MPEEEGERAPAPLRREDREAVLGVQGDEAPAGEGVVRVAAQERVVGPHDVEEAAVGEPADRERALELFLAKRRAAPHAQREGVALAEDALVEAGVEGQLVEREVAAERLRLAQPGDAQASALDRRDRPGVGPGGGDRPRRLDPAELQAVLRPVAAEHLLTLAPPGRGEALDRADGAPDGKDGLHVDLAGPEESLLEDVGRVLAADHEGRAEAVIQVEAAGVDALRDGAIGGLRAPHVAEEDVRAAGGETVAVLRVAELDPRGPEPREKHRPGPVRRRGAGGGHRIGPRRRMGVGERRCDRGAVDVEGRDDDVVPAGRVRRVRHRAPVGADRRLERPAEDVRDADERAVGEAHGVEVRHAVAVGAEDDTLAVRRPRGLDVLRAVVGELLDRAGCGVDAHDVEPAPGQEARGHDRVATRAPTWPAPLDALDGAGEGRGLSALDRQGEQVGAIARLPREDDRAPVGGDVRVVRARAAREAAPVSARDVHEAEVGEDRERLVHLQLGEDEGLAVRGPGEPRSPVAQGEAAVLRAVGSGDADLREALEGEARVGDMRAVGAEAGRHLADAASGDRDRGREARFPALLGFPCEVLAGLVRPRGPVRLEARARDPARRAAVEPRRELPRVLPPHPRDRVLPRLLAQPAEEGLAEEVRRLPARPGVERVDRLVGLREAALERGHAQDHPRVGVAPAAEGGELGLLVGGEALDHPRHREGVRKEEGRPAEDLAPETPEAAGLLEVDGVGELVDEDEAEPALVVAEVVGAVGGDRADRDERKGKRRREAVRLVVGVDEDDVDAPDPLTVALLVAGEDLGGEGRGLAGHPLEALVEVDRDAVGRDGLKAVPRRVGGGCSGGGTEEGDERQRGDDGRSAPAARRGSTHAFPA